MKDEKRKEAREAFVSKYVDVVDAIKTRVVKGEATPRELEALVEIAKLVL